MPQISVIVPVYKVEPYLRRCVDSILNQTYRDFELILVDDGSPDNCGKICDEYAAQDSRVTVIHKKNGGLSSARNAGLDIAKGEYVTFIDSDDQVAQSYLEYLFRIAEDNEAEISTCGILLNADFDNLAEENPFIAPCVVLEGRAAAMQPYKQGGLIVISACCKLYSRRLWSDIRFPVGKIHEDQAVVPIVLHRARKVTASQAKLYFYRNVEDSIMHKAFTTKRYDDIEAVDGCIAYFEEQGEKELAELAGKTRLILLAVYSINARKSGIYEQVPRGYKMSEMSALRILRKNMTDDKYTYYLAMIHPNWLRPHAYLRKIKKILHIPCK